MRIIFSFIVLIAFSGCSKENNSTSSSLGKISIDGTQYEVVSASITYSSSPENVTIYAGNYDTVNSGKLRFYYEDASGAYSCSADKTISGNESYFYDSYINSNSDYIKTNYSEMIVTKISNEKYTCKGTIYLYQNYDSTKMIIVTADFSTK